MQIDAAKKQVSDLYKSLAPIIDAVVAKHAKEIDNIVKSVKNANSLDNEDLRKYIMQLSIENYYFAESKDKAIFMQDCAIALSKEAQADIFNSTAGTQAVRNNQAIIDSMDKQAVAMLQSAVANRLKTKLDEAHRLLGSLQGILISKNAENKLKGAGNTGNAGNAGDLYDHSVSEDKSK